MLAVSIALAAKLYFTTLGLMSCSIISLHAHSTCSEPFGLKASSRLVLLESDVELLDTNTQEVSHIWTSQNLTEIEDSMR